MALPTLDSVFASAADVPRRYMLAQWLVGEKEEVAGPSSVLVSGAGADEANGTYTARGEEHGKPYYNLVDAANSVTDSSIYWTTEVWRINDPASDTYYESTEDVEFPWLVETWELSDVGTGPAPTVTEIPASNPIANYITLPERYLWAKIAVAAGGPKDEGLYINAPKQHAWSDIYNSVSGDISESTVVVSGLSATYLNGRYVYDGNFNGRPSYRLTSEINIFWGESNAWVLEEFLVGTMTSLSDVAYPWLATEWFDEGIDPTGLVLTPETPNHTDWSEKQALGHIAAAYRGDTANPANLATYIDWPWRYQVASIITAL
jgi:hypothetical protein